MEWSSRPDHPTVETDEPPDHGAKRSVLGRVDCIMSAFDNADRALTLNELSQRTELPKSTVHRMVEQLRSIGWLERDFSGYRVGMRLFEVGGLASRRTQLTDCAYPHLQALSARTGFAVQLALLDGLDVVYLERIPTGDFRLPTRQGGRMPTHCTALGKALLAFDPQAASEVLRQPLTPRTPQTITNPNLLRTELCAVSETGLAFDQQEAYDGLACVAAPVRSAGRAIAAISATGPVTRIDLHAIAPHVHNAARRVWSDRFRR